MSVRRSIRILSPNEILAIKNKQTWLHFSRTNVYFCFLYVIINPTNLGVSKMYEDLTEKQKQILEFIKKQTRECGYPPSVREICEAVGFKSTSSVHSHLKTLEQRSYIRRTSLKTRAIDVINKGDEDGLEHFQTDREMVTLPLLGKITAGDPILATEDIMDQVPLPLSFVGTGEHFCCGLRVPV